MAENSIEVEVENSLDDFTDETKQRLDDNFQNALSSLRSLRESFGSSTNSEKRKAVRKQATTSKRGRKESPQYKKISLYLLPANSTKFPTRGERIILEKEGYGYAKNPDGTQSRFTQIPLDLNEDDFLQFIKNKFPEHNLNQIVLKKSSKGRFLESISETGFRVTPKFLKDLKMTGLLIVIPTSVNTVQTAPIENRSATLNEAMLENSSVTENSITFENRSATQDPSDIFDFNDLTRNEDSGDGNYDEQTTNTISIDPSLNMEEGNETDFEQLAILNDLLIALKETLSEKTFLTISRSAVMETLLTAYLEEGIASNQLFVTFHGEEGVDMGGVTRDLFTCFWKQCLATYFTGEDSLVPFIPVGKGELSKHFVTIGKILSHSLSLTQEIPLSFCRTSLISMFLSIEEIPKPIIKEDFLLYLTPAERELLKQASSLTNFELKILERLVNLYSRFGVVTMPSTTNLYKCILEMAENELITKPFRYLSLIKAGIPSEHLKQFWLNLEIKHFVSLYNKLCPTPERVVERLLVSSSLSEQEDRIFYNLQSFILGCELTTLKSFLHFVTGSQNLPERKIEVIFKGSEGLARLPSAQTCTRTLVLSTKYETI